MTLYQRGYGEGRNSWFESNLHLTSQISLLESIVMTKIFKAFLLTVVLSLSIFAQNSVDCCCCNPEMVQLSGTITAGDSPSTYLISQRMVNVALYQLDSFNTTYVGELRVNSFGQFTATVETCHSYVLQPHITKRGQSQFPNYFDVYEPSNFLLIDIYQGQTGLNTTMTMLYGGRGIKNVR